MKITPGPWRLAMKKYRGYIIEKFKRYNTIGELKNFWHVSYYAYDTKYTMPEKFFTKREAMEYVKAITG